MAQRNVSFEMNTKVLDEMEKLCQEMGMDAEEAFQIFARKMVNEQQIPFEVTPEDVPESQAESIIKTILHITALIALAGAAIAMIHALVKMLKK